MSLIVTVDDPSGGEGFMKPAGYEDYRRTVWGMPGMARVVPMLAQIAGDLYVPREEFEEFERQCRVLDEQSDAIARGFKRKWKDGEPLRVYARYFLEALAFAREHGSDCIRIG
jgi:hypothetical protein